MVRNQQFFFQPYHRPVRLACRTKNQTMKKLNTYYFLVILSGAIGTASAQNNCAEFAYWGTGLQLAFYDTSYCSNAQMNNTTWDFGDSTAQDTGQYVNHNYSASGGYYVTMTSRDSAYNFLDDTTMYIVVSNSVSCASFNYAVNANQVGFTNTSNCSMATNYTWLFGDGNYSTSTSPTHTYNSVGTYKVTLYVYNSGSLLDSTSHNVTISTVPPPSNCAAFNYTVNFNTVTFSDSSTCSGIKNYNWVFGDGYYAVGANTSHTYASTGTYTVYLVLTDSSQNIIDSASKNVTISSMPPACMAMFTKAQALDSNNNPIPGHVVITDQSTGSNLSYYWSFGDGSSSNVKNPTHTYSGNGPYALCLTISDSSCSDTYCDTLSVDSNGNLKSLGFTIHVGGYNPGTGISGTGSGSFTLDLYPNPASEVINVNIFGLRGERASILLISSTGQLIRQDGLNRSSDGIHTVDVSDLKSGMYVLQVRTDRAAVSKVFLKN